MKLIKRIFAVCSFCTLLTVTNCFAVTLDNTNVTDDKLNCYRTYLVQEDEQNTFIDNLEKDIEVFGDKYTFDSYTTEGGTTTDTIDITTTKKITSKTNNLESIINQLGTIISYEQDGYIGEYLLNTQNIQIKTNYNGFREDLIEETINYTNLEKNDLDFIPKQTVKDGLTLDLLNVEWEVETTKMIGEYEVANLYTAKCYYAGKQRIDYPNTYSVTAEYSGTATKTIESPYIYTVKYDKIEEEKSDPVPETVEEKENNLLPVASGTTGIILVILFFFTRNVTVYNYKDGKYIKIGKTRINKSNTINLTRFSLFETTNKYKLEFSRRLTDKMQGKMITVKKGKTKIKMLVNTNDEKYIVETRM
jgi:hypothetical protein